MVVPAPTVLHAAEDPRRREARPGELETRIRARSAIYQEHDTSMTMTVGEHPARSRLTPVSRICAACLVFMFTDRAACRNPVRGEKTRLALVGPSVGRHVLLLDEPTNNSTCSPASRCLTRCALQGGGRPGHHDLAPRRPSTWQRVIPQPPDGTETTWSDIPGITELPGRPSPVSGLGRLRARGRARAFRIVWG